MVRHSLAAAFAVALIGLAAPASADQGMALPPQPKVRPAGIPVEYTMVSPCIAGMGEHWMNLRDPSSPIYGSYQGKAIFTEIMVPLTQLQSGVSYANLRAVPGYTIDHIDFKFEPQGHPGMPVPHYDLHAYYLSAAQQATICPGGLPDPSMKATSE
ncbi:MAG TPA: hypothetical protein VKR56_12880 [Candidatus Cybelea sp.]|nr:hypothetical protein [Candidatus Cybelea sp.]